MLHHQQETGVDLHLNPLAKSGFASDLRVDEYLNQLCAAVASSLDEAHNLEARNEMRIHIESLIEANIELGDSPELAVAHAIEQFGRSRIIKREWARTLSEEQQGSIRRSVGFALMFNSLAVAVGMSIVPIGVRVADDLGLRSEDSIKELGIYALPAAAGLFTGMYARRADACDAVRAFDYAAPNDDSGCVADRRVS